MRILFLALILISSGQLRLIHAAAVDLPINLAWGDAPDKLIDWGVEQSAEVAIVIPPDQPDWRWVRISATSGKVLLDGYVNQIEGRFLKGRLVELTLTQRDPKLSAATVKARFIKEKRLKKQRYGTLKVNRRHSVARNHFSTDSISYHVEPIPGLFVLLTHTEMEDQLRQIREGRFSTIFRNQNLRTQLETSSP